MFLFKRKQIVVDCFITNPTIHDIYPIDNASKFFPDGWKLLEKTKKVKVYADRYPESNIELELATSKKCIGILNLFSSGFILPSWCDFSIEIQSSGKHMWHAASDMFVDQHPSWQLWDNLYNDYGHAKIASPWIFHEKEGVKFSWHQCDWNDTDQLDKFRTLSGVVDYKYQHQTNVNMFIKKGSVVNFKAGQPLVHIIPLSERDVKIKTHLVTLDEMMKLDYKPSQYINQYKTSKQVLGKQGKCPFGFGK